MEGSILFIHSPIDGHLSCFWFVAILVAKTWTRKREQVFEI